MNSPKSDGGPAFPGGPFGDTMRGEDGRVRHQYPATEGMSLRDWFAGQALNSLLSMPTTHANFANKKLTSLEIAGAAYEWADAMIFARTAHLKSPN